ncbi:MAG: hypothetical protein AAF721_18645 [Myxococcota bacterium]
MALPSPASIRSEHEVLVQRVAAFREAWRERDKASTATVARILSLPHVGEPLSDRLQTRLLEGRRELDNAIARFGADVAGAVACATKDGDASTIERALHEELSRVARTDETFENRLHELASLVALYCRLATALGHR